MRSKSSNTDGIQLNVTLLCQTLYLHTERPINRPDLFPYVYLLFTACHLQSMYQTVLAGLLTNQRLDGSALLRYCMEIVPSLAESKKDLFA